MWLKRFTTLFIIKTRQKGVSVGSHHLMFAKIVSEDVRSDSVYWAVYTQQVYFLISVTYLIVKKIHVETFVQF